MNFLSINLQYSPVNAKIKNVNLKQREHNEDGGRHAKAKSTRGAGCYLNSARRPAAYDWRSESAASWRTWTLRWKRLVTLLWVPAPLSMADTERTSRASTEMRLTTQPSPKIAFSGCVTRRVFSSEPCSLQSSSWGPKFHHSCPLRLLGGG